MASNSSAVSREERTMPLVRLGAFEDAAAHIGATVLFPPPFRKEQPEFSDLVVPLPVNKVKQSVDDAMMAWDQLGQERGAGSSSDPTGLLQRVEQIRKSVPSISALKTDSKRKLAVLKAAEYHAEGTSRSEYTLSSEDVSKGILYDWRSTRQVQTMAAEGIPDTTVLAPSPATRPGLLEATFDCFINCNAGLLASHILEPMQLRIRRHVAQTADMDIEDVRLTCVEDIAVRGKKNDCTEVKMCFALALPKKALSCTKTAVFRQNLCNTIATIVSVDSYTVRLGRVKVSGAPLTTTVVEAPHRPPPQRISDSMAPGDLVVQLAVFCPKSTSRRIGKGKRAFPAKAAEFIFRGTQSLFELMDTIECSGKLQELKSSNDPQIIKRWASANIDVPRRGSQREARPSFLFIEHTFYDDNRALPNAVCQSRPLSTPTVQFLKSKPGRLGHIDGARVHARGVVGVSFRDLSVRLNTPYIYCHKNNCEHPFTFTDIRLYQPDIDPPEMSQYPVKVFERQRTRKVCDGCNHVYANVACHESDLAGVLPAYLCNDCYVATHVSRSNGSSATVYTEAYEHDSML